MNDLIDRIAALFELTRADLISRSRRRHVALARQAAAWALRRVYPTLSLEDVGALLGGRDHTTIMYAVSKIDDLLLADAALARELLSLVGDAPPDPPQHPRTDRAMKWWATQGRANWIVLAA